MKSLWFTCGTLVGLTTLSISLGSVPRRGTVTNDTVLYQNLSETRVPKEPEPDFDDDIRKLSRMESRYREPLPRMAQYSRAPVRRRADGRPPGAPRGPRPVKPAQARR